MENRSDDVNGLADLCDLLGLSGEHLQQLASPEHFARSGRHQKGFDTGFDVYVIVRIVCSLWGGGVEDIC